MPHPFLSLHPPEAAKLILSTLPTKRMRDVIEKRFGMKGGRKRTLDAIGKEYRVTRERIRQIEAEALRHLRKNALTNAELQPFIKALSKHLEAYGGVMASSHLFSQLAEERFHPHLAFLVEISDVFETLPENERFNRCTAVNREHAASIEKIMDAVEQRLDAIGHSVSKQELDAIIGGEVKNVRGEAPGAEVIDSYLGTVRLIGKNPYGEYGLMRWPTIQPRGIKDKAYLVLAKSGKPLHFREVASAIDTIKWSRKRAHPQTVHNELIKDPRFILVGRGLYALEEWGYERGTVHDIMVSVLRTTKHPLSKEEIIRLVLEKRLVRPPTVLLNLQNKKIFRKTEEGKFTLV